MGCEENRNRFSRTCIRDEIQFHSSKGPRRNTGALLLENVTFDEFVPGRQASLKRTLTQEDWSCWLQYRVKSTRRVLLLAPRSSKPFRSGWRRDDQ